MLSQSAYLFVSKVFGYGLRILLPAFLVRILPKSDIGLYSQFFLLEMLIKTLFQLGINQSQFYFVPRDEKNAGGYLLNSTILNIGLFGLAYILIGHFRLTLANQLRMPVLEEFFHILIAHSFIMMMNVIFSTYMQARKWFRQAAVYEVYLQVLASIATLVAALLTRDLHWIFLALVGARVIGAASGAAYIHFGRRGFGSREYFFGMWRQFRYGVPLGLAGLLFTLMSQMHQFVVNRFYDIETYAVYAQGLKQIPVLQFYAQSVAAVALVRFAQLEKAGDWQGIKEFWNKLLASMYGLGLPVIAGFLIVAQPLVVLMFTRNYIDAVPIFRINVLGSLFFLLNPTLVLRALDRNDISVKVHATLAVILPFMLYLGMKIWGLNGIIAVHAANLILARVINHFILNRIAPLHLPYFPPYTEVQDFYRESAQKVLAKARVLFSR